MQQDLPEEGQRTDIRGMQAHSPAAPLSLPTALHPAEPVSSGYRPWLDTVAPRPVYPAAQHRYADRAAFSPDFPAQTGPSLETSSLLHDTRNMLGALQLYSDLLEEPGVLTPPYGHYASELRLIGDACRRLLERLMLIASPEFPQSDAGISPVLARQSADNTTEPIQNLAAELEMNRSLLAAIAGPAIRVSLTRHGGNLPLAMAREDLVRILVNLVRNAAHAMPGGGAIEIDLEESAQALTLTFSDTGSGIPQAALEAVFSPGYTTGLPLTANVSGAANSMQLPRRGLGLPIVRSLVSTAGGSVRAARRMPGSGTLIILEFPLPTAVPRESPAASAPRHPV